MKINVSYLGQDRRGEEEQEERFKVEAI